VTARGVGATPSGYGALHRSGIEHEGRGKMTTRERLQHRKAMLQAGAAREPKGEQPTVEKQPEQPLVEAEKQPEQPLVEAEKQPEQEQGAPTVAESRRQAEQTLRKGAADVLVGQQDAAVASLKRNLALTTAMRAVFYLLSALILLVVIYYIAIRFDELVDVLLRDRGSTETVLAVSTPVVIGLVAAIICAGLALLVQERGNAEFRRALEAMGRLAREGSAVDSRSRALTQILEETLVNARQAFTLQLWISRVLFGTGIVLLFTFVVSLFIGNALFTGGAAGSAVLSFAAAALFNPQRQIGSDLANVTQLEAILGGYTRQAALIEEHVYDVMVNCRDQMAAHDASPTVWAGIDRLSSVLQGAVRAIDEHVQAKDPVTPREEWLMQQLIGASPAGSLNGQPQPASSPQN